MNLGETIKEGNEESQQDYAKTLIFLRHHLHEDLENKYLTVKDPSTMWNNLKDIFYHQKIVILPKACYDWMTRGCKILKQSVSITSLYLK